MRQLPEPPASGGHAQLSGGGLTERFHQRDQTRAKVVPEPFLRDMRGRSADAKGQLSSGRVLASERHRNRIHTWNAFAEIAAKPKRCVIFKGPSQPIFTQGEVFGGMVSRMASMTSVRS